MIKDFFEMKCYAAYINTNIRLKCSSGGIFSSLAYDVIVAGGVVYGVEFSEDWKSAKYCRVSDLYNLDKLYGSKYIQANVGNTYHSVRQDLMSGLIVLFSGTTCQINGLKLFLKKDYPNLLCVDVICHGVPSQKLWQSYLASKPYRIENVSFRCKKNGWYDSGIEENGMYIPQKQHTYMSLFLKDYCLRPSCYNCVSKKNKQSDITLGDLWGVRDIAQEINDNLGISSVIIRSEKGEKAFLKLNVVCKEITYEQAVSENPAEYSSAVEPVQRKLFYNYLNKHSYEDTVKMFLAPSVFAKVVFKTLKITRKAKRLIKKLLGKN